MSLEEAFEKTRFTFEFYGILQYQIVEFLMIFLQLGEFSANSPETYFYQNLFNFTISFISLISVTFSLIKVYYLKFGLQYLAIVSTSSIWFGHSLMNYKDAPVMAGILFLVSGILLHSQQTRETYQKILGPTLMALGSTIAIGSRPGSLPIILVIAYGTLIIFYGIQEKNLSQKTQTFFIFTIACLLTPVITLFLTNPFAKIDMYEWLTKSVLVAGNYDFWIGATLTFGQEIPSTVPFWYIGAWLYAQTPLIYFGLMVFGIIHFSIYFTFEIKNRKKFLLDNFIVIPFILQGILIPVILFIYKTNLYNGIRQIIFIFPALMFFIPFLIHNSDSSFLRNIKIYLERILNFGIFLSFLQILVWFPYNYAYLNEFESNFKPNLRWESDYWGLSSREGVDKLTFQFKLKSDVAGEGNYTNTPFEKSQIIEDYNENYFGLYYTIRNNNEFLPNNCRQIFEVKRLKTQIGVGYKCPN
jgi:hypothetical protein